MFFFFFFLVEIRKSYISLRNREPMPINLKAQDLQKEVLLAAKSTHMNFMKGNCYAVKIATTGQTDTAAFENFMSAYTSIAQATPGGEEAIRSLQIKTANSVSLPIYENNEQY